MSNDKIMVTVTAPEGRRVIVTTKDANERQLGYGPPMEFTVTGGASQQFFVDEIRSLIIKEGFPQFIVDDLDRKPVGSAEAVAREKLGLGKDEPLA